MSFSCQQTIHLHFLDVQKYTKTAQTPRLSYYYQSMTAVCNGADRVLIPIELSCDTTTDFDAFYENKDVGFLFLKKIKLKPEKCCIYSYHPRSYSDSPAAWGTTLATVEVILAINSMVPF